MQTSSISASVDTVFPPNWSSSLRLERHSTGGCFQVLVCGPALRPYASQSAVWDLLDVSRRERSLTAEAGRGLGAQGHRDDSRGCQLPTCSVTRHPSHLCGGFPGAPMIILAAKGVTGDLGSFLLVWEILEGLEVSAKEVGEGLALSVVAEVSVMC